MLSAAPASRRVPPPTARAPDRDPAPAAETIRTGGGSGRDAFFGNAKYLAIVLAVMGHSREPLTGQSRAADALYMTVYAFRMPAFIVISGYFSRGFDLRADRLRRLVTGVVAPYAVFETAHTLFARRAAPDPEMPVSLLGPWYLTWFLAALFVWRLTTRLWWTVR